MSRLDTCCAKCGARFTRAADETQCYDCKPDTAPRKLDLRGTPTDRGYDKHWTRLSRRARKLQPWCTDCGSPDDLTADHSPAAWDRHDRGLSVRLVDIDVVCRRCNAARGAARGPRARDRWTFGADAERLDKINADDDQGGNPLDSVSLPRGQERI